MYHFITLAVVHFNSFLFKKNIFSSYYNTIMIFFFGNSSAKSTFKISTQIDLPANYCSR